jgi:hypothetical protein
LNAGESPKGLHSAPPYLAASPPQLQAAALHFLCRPFRGAVLLAAVGLTSTRAEAA